MRYHRTPFPPCGAPCSPRFSGHSRGRRPRSRMAMTRPSAPHSPRRNGRVSSCSRTAVCVPGGTADTAGAATFFDLPYASYAFDLIAGPDNWRLITSAPRDRGIVCGAMSPAAGGDERPETLVWAAHYAASTRGLDRVGLANAPGLDALPWDVAIVKLARVAEAARIAALPSPDALAQALDPRAVSSRSAALGRVTPPPPRTRRRKGSQRA